jgi:Subtilase family
MSGKILTEGDKITKADTARQSFNIDGSGIKIGIISTSFDAQKQSGNDVANGELPGENNPVKILKDLKQGSNGADDEGRALAQVVHDVAPGAEILFSTAVGDSNTVDDKSYSEAVDALVNAGADVIVDDVIFPTSIFQDGGAAQAAKNAVDKGVVFVSAAGNNGKISYQSEYQSDGTTFEIGGKTFEALDFDASKNVDVFQDITATKDKTNLLPLLTWSEPNGEVSNDLEMFLLSSPDLPNSKADNVLSISGIPSPKEDTASPELIERLPKDVSILNSIDPNR